MNLATVLIVDDAAFMRGSLKYIVESLGHEVVGLAKNGEQGIALYNENQPDLVTLDILMGEMDGLEVLAEIMKINENATVIMVTALGQEEKQKEARSLGASGYIKKPFSSEQIAEEFARILDSKGK